MSSCSSGIVSGDAYHVLKIDGYSRIRDTKDGFLRLTSCPFLAGGHTWKLVCFTLGSFGAGNMDYITVYLILERRGTVLVDAAVIAQATFSLLDQDGKPVPSYSRTTPKVDFSKQGSYGYDRFVNRSDLEQSSELLVDDCFAVRVDVHVFVSVSKEDEAPAPSSSTSTIASDMLLHLGHLLSESVDVNKEAEAPAAPSSSTSTMASDMHRHLGHLLSESKAGTDVEFRVRGETFVAHRSVLRARSPVFKAQLQQLLSTAAGTNAGAVQIILDDIEPPVFKALLTFIYTDAIPAAVEMETSSSDDDDCFPMTESLLAAADTYGLARLKLICEYRLCGRINTRSVSTLLALAEKHRCPGLKEACFDFLGSKEALFAVIETREYEHLARICPAITNELIYNVLNRKKANDSGWAQEAQVSVIKVSSETSDKKLASSRRCNIL